MVHVGPVRVFDLRDRVRLQPASFGHLVGGQTLPPSALVALGQVRKGARLDFELVETLEDLYPKSRDETGPHARNVDARQGGIVIVRTDTTFVVRLHTHERVRADALDLAGQLDFPGRF